MFYIKALFVMLLCIAAYVAGGLTYDRVAPRVSPWLKRIPFGRLKTDFGKALLVALLCFTAYLSNGRTLPLDMGGDTIPTRLIPFSILRYGEVTVAPFRQYLYVGGRPQWYLRERRGTLISMYPIGGSIAALPFYLPSYAYLTLRGATSASELFHASEKAEKLASAAMIALAVGAFYLTVRRRLTSRQSFWAAIAFGLGSLMWGNASEMLWQQSIVAALLTFALWFLTWPELPAWAAGAAGAMLGLSVATRPSAIIFFGAGVLSAFVLGRAFRRGMRNALLFIAAGIPFILFNCLVNYYYYGSPTGLYDFLLPGLIQDIIHLRRLDGIAGMLVSPNRGLFIYTPIALLGIWGILRQIKPAAEQGPRDPILVLFGLTAIGHLIIFGSYETWYAGFTYGPRYTVEITPILALAAADAWLRVPRWARVLTIAVLPWCIFVEFVGAFCYPAGHWVSRVGEAWPKEVWNWRDFAIFSDFQAWLHSNVKWASPWSL
jgi:hypothetical protein